jgi:hypothetical protein
MRVKFEALQCKLFRALVGVSEVRGAGFIWLSFDAPRRRWSFRKKEEERTP